MAEVPAAPESNRAVIEAFRVLVEQAAKGLISQAEVTQKAAELSPKYANVIESFAIFGLPGLALLVTLIGLYLQYLTYEDSSKASDALLKALQEQTLILKREDYQGSIHRERANPSSKESKQKSSLEKNPSQRRKHNPHE